MNITGRTVIEVTATPEIVSGFPLVPYRPDGQDRGYYLSVDRVAGQYLVTSGEGDMVLRGLRVHGIVVAENGDTLSFGQDGRTITPDARKIPEELSGIVAEMRTHAGTVLARPQGA
jgi:hypothetical protein